ncbi:MAG: hypothetical protein IPG02_15715 [Ignavibacteria bacterium]|nr:hypothetical protein [Ignavibacteria bacterium]
MYSASLVCILPNHIGNYPSRWMDYHLLDGDWASNTCSWQWVAGANSNKNIMPIKRTSTSLHSQTRPTPIWINRMKKWRLWKHLLHYYLLKSLCLKYICLQPQL